jgi:hypothetical protein
VSRVPQARDAQQRFPKSLARQAESGRAGHPSPLKKHGTARFPSGKPGQELGRPPREKNSVAWLVFLVGGIRVFCSSQMYVDPRIQPPPRQRFRWAVWTEPASPPRAGAARNIALKETNRMPSPFDRRGQRLPQRRPAANRPDRREPQRNGNGVRISGSLGSQGAQFPEISPCDRRVIGIG